jgi:hypothetical protein
MLTIYDGYRAVDRRKFLSIGGLAGLSSLGLGGLTIPSLLNAINPASAADSFLSDKARGLTGKSVIFLFQQGGPSQLETFDPKPEASQATRTVTGVTQTNVPGVTFGSTMKRLSTMADKLAIVRSFQTNNGGHNIQPVVGPDSEQANIGAYYGRIAGATRTSTGMPTNAILYPAAVDRDVPGPSARGDLTSTGTLGTAYKPFVPGGKGNLQDDMKVKLPHDRFFGDRKALLAQLDRLNRDMDSAGDLQSMDELQQQAYQLLLGGGVSKALDLSLEDPRVVQRYDTSHFTQSHDWRQASRGRAGFYTANAKCMGKLLLLARRLCEAGCGFVTIHAGYAGVWDMHADGNNLNMNDGMQAVGQSFDHAVAAFVEDIEARGLQDKIMLVTCGEMGRTPRINRNGGRDHWSKLSPLMMYGGGLKGQVIGRSTRDGGEPATANFTPKNLLSSILHTTLDVAKLRIIGNMPQQVARLVDTEPIPAET